MRRAFLGGLIAVLVTGAAFLALGAGDSAKGKRYKIVFDSAFGLTKGADFKVGGVAVGSISDLTVHEPDARALVTVQATKGGDGFAGLRADSTCTINPQSLIGEYFVDCQPGTKGKLLKSGATVPVKRTTSPIPPDLVLDVMRRPVAERFAIIFSQLGVGLAARGRDVNETVRRAIPAIQTTDDVLRILARRRQTLADLGRESGQVLKVLGRRRADVTAFITQTKNAATATADRRAAVAETFRRFPGFLDELQPTMRDLGTATRQFTPALADLRAAAPSVTALLNTLRPFSLASRPAVTTLGQTSKSGRVASREARSLVSNLGTLGRSSAEPSKNLRIILDHLDDRKYAVEKDSDSPGGAGYTGLEAPLQYIFDQSLAANIFDQRGYALKINLSAGECGNYTDAAGAKADPAKYQRCNQNLGPNQPGITSADPSATSTRSERTRRGRRGDRSRDPRSPAAPSAPSGSPTATATPAPGGKPIFGLKPVQDLIDNAQQVVPNTVGGVTGGADKGSDPANDLLDFLLKP